MAVVTVKSPTGKVITKKKLTDARPYWIYDTATLSTSLADTYVFQSPEGSDNKTIIDTNLKQFSTLQVGWQFVCNKIRIIPRFMSYGDATNAVSLMKDIDTIFSYGVLSFLREGDIEVWRAPLILFGAGCGPMSSVATADSTNAPALASWSNGLPSAGSVMVLPIPIILVGGRTFTFKLSFATGKTLEAERKLWVCLEGMLSREVVGG